jgi:sugar phosphate isomerase/epimerase
MMTDIDLIASAWTTAGDAAPGRGDERSPHSLRKRIEAASAAGFKGFGLLHADLVVARERYGYPDMRRMFEDHGLDQLELEFLGDWWTDGPRRSASDAVRADLLEAAETLGARHIKVAPELGDDPWDHDLWAREFAKLAAEAESAGTRVALEFLPMFNVRALHEALSIVRSADHPAGGLLIDIWHVARAGTPFAEVAAVPAELIVAIELDDASAEPLGSLLDDTIDERRLPGQGDLDVPGFIRTIQSTGWTGPWGVEILSKQYRARPIEEATKDAFQATMAQFGLAATSVDAAGRSVDARP